MTPQIIARYVPVSIDRFQSPQYTHVETRLYDDGSLMALFLDGTEVPSVYLTVDDMLQAASTDYRERMRLVTI